MAHVNLGFVLAHKKDWNRAIAEYHEGLRLNPNNEFGHFFLGNALEKKGDWREALEEYRKACVLNPNNTAYRQSYERLLRHK
jgi:tetratricopeptide (TPR) repeat protein